MSEPSLCHISEVPAPLPDGPDPSWEPTQRVEYAYDPRCTHSRAYPVDPPIPWNLPKCLEEQGGPRDLTIYSGIRVDGDPWMKMACDEARFSAEHQGGPFGAVILHVDRETQRVTEFWRSHNHVVLWSDPTAHAEMTTIRFACAELSRRFGQPVTDLGQLVDPKTGRESFCVIYSSAEPCPMCYAAVNWAGLKALIFGATRFDAAAPGVDFSDEAIYADMARPYKDREKLEVRRACCPNALDAFQLWKKHETVHY